MEYFKGWAKPGPLRQGEDFGPTDGETLDALCGHYKIFQLDQGHRFSTDDILTAWYGTTWCPSAGRVLDLGSGIGSVGMVAAWRLRGASFVTVEAQDISVALAKKSARYNGLTNRFEIRHGDFRAEGVLKETETFDLVLGSPPYFPVEAGLLGDHPQKVACRFELRGDILDYCKVASNHLNLGGVFACIFPIQPEHQFNRVLEAAKKSELSIVRRRSIIFKEGEPALLSLFLMVKSQHLPEKFRDQTWVEPPLMVRTAEGKVHPEYSAVKLAIGFPP